MYYEPIETGKRICIARKTAGITQEAMAEKLGISLDHYARMERGKRYWSVDVLAEISQLLDLSMDYLVFGRNAAPDNIKERLKASFDEILGSL